MDEKYLYELVYNDKITQNQRKQIEKVILSEKSMSCVELIEEVEHILMKKRYNNENYTS